MDVHHVMTPPYRTEPMGPYEAPCTCGGLADLHTTREAARAAQDAHRAEIAQRQAGTRP